MRRIAFLIALALFMPLCVSTPIPYDTAQIPDNKGKAIIGGGAQYYNAVIGIPDLCGGVTYYHYQATYIRGDVQTGYGFKKFAEIGVQGGAAAGLYTERTITGLYTENDTTYRLFVVDAYPYIKFGIPTDLVRFSLKLSPGGFLGGASPVGIFAFPYGFLDFMLGFGKVEHLTLGIRSEVLSLLIYPYISIHRGGFTFSFMAGYIPLSDIEYSFKAYFGLAKRF